MATHDFPATSATITPSDLPTAIDAAKLADGSVSNAEFQRLDGVTSAIQTQLDAKLATDADFARETGTWTTLNVAKCLAIGKTKALRWLPNVNSMGWGIATSDSNNDLSIILDNAGTGYRVLYLSNSGAATLLGGLTIGGALAGVTTLNHSGAQTMSGSPASAGASVRNRHGLGGTTDIVDNVPTGGAIHWTVNGGTDILRGNAADIYTSLVYATASGSGLRLTTSDGSDNGFLQGSGGGGFGNDRAGGWSAYGNEHATNPGCFHFASGNVTGGHVRVYTGNGILRLQISDAGAVTGGVINAASGLCGLGAGGYVAQAQLGSGSGGAGAKVLADNQTWITPASADTGSIALWPKSTPPTGYLSCDGSAVSRSSYATLFALISTTWGVGDGSTTFNLPDFRGRAPIGVGTGSGLTARALADQVGAESVTLTGAQSGLPVGIYSAGIAGNAGTASLQGTVASVGAQNAASSHTNMQPSLAVYFIIKT